MVKVDNVVTESSFRFLLKCPNEQFLENAYLILLGRMPDQIGLLHYAQRLQNGIPRQVVLAEIWHTQLKQGTTLSKSAEMNKMVARYQAVRGLPIGKMRWRLLPRFGIRIPDISKFDWTGWARSYLSDVYVSVKNLPSRDESFTQAEDNESIDWPSLSFADLLALPDAAFVEQTFRLLLGRKIDDAGMLEYLSVLLEGRERLLILQDIYHSEEATRVRTLSDLDDVVDNAYLSAVYQRLLGRNPDPAAIKSYQPLTDNNQRKKLLAALLSSSEYQQRHAHTVKFESEMDDALRQWSLEKTERVFSDAADDPYLHWIEQHERLSEQDRKSLTHRARGWTKSPLITVVIHTRELNLDYLVGAILSVRHQVYSQWQLVVAVPYSLDAKIEANLRVHTAADSRIRIECFSDSGNDLPEVCSKVLEETKNGYLLFMDSMDQLAEIALFWIAETLRNHPECRLVYSDEDTISADGIRSDPYFKPDYNYELHLAQDLMGRTCVFELNLLKSIGGFRPGCVGAEYWDISLRAVEKLNFDQIAHVTRVLYHQRAGNTLPAEEIRLRVMQEHLKRKGIKGNVTPAPGVPQYNRVIYERASVQPSVTIIIPTRDHADLLDRCIDSIRQKSTYRNYNILIVDNGSRELATLELLKKLGEEKEVCVERMDIPFNFSTLNNEAAKKTSSDLLCFLNDDTEILTSDWLEEMSAFATQKDVGIVGARLWYPDGRLQHAGVITGIHGVCDHFFRGLEPGKPGYYGRALLHQSMSAVTGACMMVRRSIFEEARGFDDSFPVTCNDIDLCLKTIALGYRNVWTPYAEIIHHECASRGQDSEVNNRARAAYEVLNLVSRWGDSLYKDVAYNPQLTLRSSDCTFAWPPRQTRFTKIAELSFLNLAKQWFHSLRDAPITVFNQLRQGNGILNNLYDTRTFFQIPVEVQRLLASDPLIINELPSDPIEQEQILASSGLFNRNWYAKKYPDAINFDPILHYCIYGHKEGRDFCLLFDTRWYKKSYGLNPQINPIIHYLFIGHYIGCNPSKDFDGMAYINKYLKRDMKINPLVHFLTVGRSLGHKPQKSDSHHYGQKAKGLSESLLPDLAWITGTSLKNFTNKYSGKEVFFNSKNLKITFIIPDFGVGGGGHMTIFRMIKWLEFFGHDVSILIFNASFHSTENEAYYDIIKFYQTLKAQIRFVGANLNKESGDAIFATGWDTVFQLSQLNNFKRKFYFVQDHESSFYPSGSRKLLSELTYDQDIDCVCAGKWLSDLMSKRYGRWSDFFDLAYDKHIFYPGEGIKLQAIPRIAFYSRVFTERRGVEIGLLALDILAKRGIQFHVDFFGYDLDVKEAPYSFEVHGVRSPGFLADLYRNSTIGLCFSLTNYSLVPQEMMACGLPIIEFDGPNTRAIFGDSVTYATFYPEDVADRLEYLIGNDTERNEKIKLALDYVAELDWEKSARKLEKIIVDRLEGLLFVDQIDKNSSANTDNNNLKASLIIPVNNGGARFIDVIESVLSQRVPWHYEVIILDSESNDGSLELVPDLENIHVYSIPKAKFNHGNTRNFGVSKAKGEFTVFLTHDAIPADEWWLYNMVTHLEHYPDAGGAFGKHVAHEEAGFFTELEIDLHFSQFENFPLFISSLTQKPNSIGYQQWQQMLHYFSDNNSCMRRDVLLKIPFRNVKYGEDQLWAFDIIASGYGKIYTPSAIVRHSHEYDIETAYNRAKIDAAYFKFFFGYELIGSEDELVRASEAYEKDIMLTCYEKMLPDELGEKQVDIINARLKGYFEGRFETQLFEVNNNTRSQF